MTLDIIRFSPTIKTPLQCSVFYSNSSNVLCTHGYYFRFATISKTLKSFAYCIEHEITSMPKTLDFLGIKYWGVCLVFVNVGNPFTKHNDKCYNLSM